MKKRIWIPLLSIGFPVYFLLMMGLTYVDPLGILDNEQNNQNYSDITYSSEYDDFVNEVEGKINEFGEKASKAMSPSVSDNIVVGITSITSKNGKTTAFGYVDNDNDDSVYVTIQGTFKDKSGYTIDKVTKTLDVIAGGRAAIFELAIPYDSAVSSCDVTVTKAILKI